MVELLLNYDLIVSNIIGILFISPKIIFSNQIYSIIGILAVGEVACSISLILKIIIKKIKFSTWKRIGLVDKLLTSILLLYSIILLLSNINLLLSKGYDKKIMFLLSMLFLAYIVLITLILYRIAKSIKIRMQITRNNFNIKKNCYSNRGNTQMS